MLEGEKKVDPWKQCVVGVGLLVAWDVTSVNAVRATPDPHGPPASASASLNNLPVPGRRDSFDFTLFLHLPRFSAKPIFVD